MVVNVRWGATGFGKTLKGCVSFSSKVGYINNLFYLVLYQVFIMKSKDFRWFAVVLLVFSTISAAESNVYRSASVAELPDVPSQTGSYKGALTEPPKAPIVLTQLFASGGAGIRNDNTPEKLLLATDGDLTTITGVFGITSTGSWLSSYWTPNRAFTGRIKLQIFDLVSGGSGSLATFGFGCVKNGDINWLYYNSLRYSSPVFTDATFDYHTSECSSFVINSRNAGRGNPYFYIKEITITED